MVRVPVLSKATAVSSEAFCSASPRLTKIPLFAATPVLTCGVKINTALDDIQRTNGVCCFLLTSMAVGVASPKAHGHALTQTERPKLKAKSNGLLSYRCSSSSDTLPRRTDSSQTTKVTTERTVTKGTKYCTQSTYYCEHKANIGL